MEAVNQGSVVLALRGKNTIAMCSLERHPSDLASYQKKMFYIDDHIGIGISGLTSDGRRLTKFMQGECINHKYSYGTPQPIERLVVRIADKKALQTQGSKGRPYGVGLLVMGVDQTGPRLFQTCPSGNYYEYKGIAIGARAQPAKTYLERVFEEAQESTDTKQLIAHVIKALAETIKTKDMKLTIENTSVALVGVDQPFRELTNDEISEHIDALDQSGEEEDDDDDDDDDGMDVDS